MDHEKAKKIAAVHRSKDDGTVRGAFHRETAETIEALLKELAPDPSGLMKEPGFFYAKNDSGTIWRISHAAVERDILAWQARMDAGQLEQPPEDRYTAPVSLEDMEDWLGDNIHDMGSANWEIVFNPRPCPDDDHLQLIEKTDGQNLFPQAS